MPDESGKMRYWHGNCSIKGRHRKLCVMKTLIISLLATVLASNTSFAQTLDWKTLAGRWEAADGSGIEVVDSTKIYLIYGDQKKQVSKFSTDFTKAPAWFDFTVTDSSQSISMHSLLLLLNDDLIKWQVFEEGPHAAYFSSDNGDLLYLKRKRK
jgi:hypothetical protein